MLAPPSAITHASSRKTTWAGEEAAARIFAAYGVTPNGDDRCRSRAGPDRQRAAQEHQVRKILGALGAPALRDAGTMQKIRPTAIERVGRVRRNK